MADCKWMKNEICVNPDCPMRADYCPVADIPHVCIYEERLTDRTVVRCKECRNLYDGDDDYCCKLHVGMAKITPYSFCSYGERKE